MRAEQKAEARGELLRAGVDLGTARGQRRALEHAMALVTRSEPNAVERSKAIALIVKTAVEVNEHDCDDDIDRLQKQVAEVHFVEPRRRRRVLIVDQTNNPVAAGAIAASGEAFGGDHAEPCPSAPHPGGSEA